MIARFLKDKFFQNSFIYVSGTLFAGSLGYLFHFLISRKLSVAEYGELQGLLALLGIVGVFSSSLSYFVIKYSSAFAKQNDFGATRAFIEWVNSQIHKLVIAFLVLFVLASPFIHNYLKLSDFVGIIAVGFAIVFGILTTVYAAAFAGWQDFLLVNVIGAFGSLLKLFFGLLIAIFLAKASFVIFSVFIAAAGGWFLARFFAKKKFFKGPAEKIDWKEKYFPDLKIREIVFPIFIFSLMIALLSDLDVLLVKNLTSPEITGYFGALKILGKIILWINLAIVAVVLPEACAEGHAGQNISLKKLLGAYGLIVFTSACATLIYFFFPEFTIKLFFGAKYAVFGPDLWLFGIIALILSLLMFEANIAYARHDFKISYILGFSALLMTIFIYLFHETIRQTALGIIFAVFIGYFFALILNLIHRKREEVDRFVALDIP